MSHDVRIEEVTWGRPYERYPCLGLTPHIAASDCHAPNHRVTPRRSVTPPEAIVESAAQLPYRLTTRQ